MQQQITAYLLLGTNIGNRKNNLQLAVELIETQCGKLLLQSSIYETAAWGFTEQPNFLNQVVAIKTTLTPKQLLQHILDIEQKMGRIREKKMGPRIIDIDILLYENKIINEENLQIPHPRMQDRKFVLIPLHEIASHILHPIYKKNISEMLKLCTDTLDVKKFY